MMVFCALAGAIGARQARAQGGGMSGGRGGGMGRGGGASHAGSQDPQLAGLMRAADPDNPIALMLASRTELKLADSQLVSLRTISHALNAQNLPLRERLDSLRPPGDTARAVDFVDLSGRERDSILQTRRAVAQLVGALHDNAVQGRAAALKLFTPAQRAQYSDIEQRVANASPQDTAAQQHGGGGRGGGRGRPSGMPASGTPAGVSSP